MAGFSETGFFPIYLSGPIGRTFNFADGHESALHAPQLFWLAQKFNQPVFGWSEQPTKSPHALDVLWYQRNSVGPREAKLPLDRYFRAAEVATFRSEWENPKALFVGFKAGDNKANHSHLDLGSFVFDALGARWAMDLGSDDYNLPGYFGAQRFTYYRLRAEGQNTLLINPGMGPDQDPAAAAKIIRFQSKPESAYAISDLTAAYKQNARKVWRGIAIPERNKLLVQDEIQTDKPAEVWWFMHTPAAMRIEDDGRTAILKQVGVELRAELLSPAAATFQIMDAQPLPSSPNPERQAKNETSKNLTIHLTGVRNVRLAVRLLPVDGKPTVASEKSELIPLTEW